MALKKLNSRHKRSKTQIFLALIFLSFTLFLIPIDKSQAVKREQINYFASLRSSEANVRSGPGRIYPVKFTFRARNIPVLVVTEYDNWNEIKDYEGQTGWISKSLLTKKRSLMVRTSRNTINMHKRNNLESKVILKLQTNVIGKYLGCKEEWCKMEIDKEKGWVQKKYLFGH